LNSGASCKGVSQAFVGHFDRLGTMLRSVWWKSIQLFWCLVIFIFEEEDLPFRVISESLGW